jgi:acyl dehydratase
VSETVEYFEDIDIGDDIAELDICPTTADVVRFVDVARMQSGRFTDDEYARKEGLPGAIVPGNMSLGFLARMLTEFFPTGTLKELTANFRATVPHNTALTGIGVVTEKQTRNGEHILFCDVMLSNDEGERYVQGTAQIALPSCSGEAVQKWGACMDRRIRRFTAPHLPCTIASRVSQKQPPQTDQIHGERLCAFSAFT